MRKKLKRFLLAVTGSVVSVILLWYLISDYQSLKIGNATDILHLLQINVNVKEIDRLNTFMNKGKPNSSGSQKYNSTDAGLLRKEKTTGDTEFETFYKTSIENNVFQRGIVKETKRNDSEPARLGKTIQNETISKHLQEMDRNETSFGNANHCPDILSGMTKGHWVTRRLSTKEQILIDKYIQKERGAYRIPSTYQRDDGRCGDVPYKYSPLYRHMWFKAICDPKGNTPCCKTNRCISASEEQCRCPACYDERQAIHSEFAKWKPDDPRCEIKHFTSPQACALLRGATVHFVGDSFIRHVFAALVIVLTGNKVDGALKKSILPHKRKECMGMHQITGLSCRDLLDQDRLLCNGTVKVKYTQVFPAKEFDLIPPLLRSLRHVNKSLVVLGLGIHDDFSVRDVVKWFLLPFLNLRQTLSSDLKANPDLYKILTNFGNLNDRASDFDLTAKDIYSAVNKSNTKNYSDRYEYLFQNKRSNGLADIDINPRYSTGFLISPTDRLKKHWYNVSDFIHGLYPTFLNSRPLSSADENGMQGENSMNFTEIKDNTSYSENSLRESKKSINSSNPTNPPIIFEVLPKAGIDVSHLWPRLLWVGIHSPGLLKSPKFKEQTPEGIQNFNKEIQEVLKLWKVPYLETFTFSNGTVSFDGTHYGWGINMLKVNMILTYVQDSLISESGWRSNS